METIVYAYVTGDIIHEGHLIHLENAKALGDKLIVGVLTDRAVMEKKPKPVLHFLERMKLVKALKCVDCVVSQETYSPIENINEIRPDILIESNSHTGRDLEDTYKEAMSLGIRVIKMPYFKEQSSTKIKEKIKKCLQKNM